MLKDNPLSFWRRLVDFLRSAPLAWLVLFISLFGTFVGWRATRGYIRQRARVQFERKITTIKNAVEQRLANYIDVLYGVRGVFELRDTAAQKELSFYIRSINLRQMYPGIEAIGYSLRVRSDRLAAHTQTMRLRGLGGYGIKPAGPRLEYQTIVYTEPFVGRNRETIGFDMSTIPVEREAMDRARDTGQPTFSGKVVSATTSKDDQPTFFIYLPIYQNGSDPKTVEERRKLLVGFIYSAFRMNDLMMGILGFDPPDIDFNIYDRASMELVSLLYDNPAKAPSPRYKSRLMETMTLNHAGQPWTLFFATLPLFDQAVESSLPRLILGAGVLISFLMFGIALSLSRTRANALRLAEQMTAELRSSQNRLEKVNHELRDFASAVSHDLKAPLRGISSLASWIESDYADRFDAEGKENMRLLIERVRRMNNLIDGLLQLARVGHSEGGQTTCDLNVLLREVIDLIHVPSTIEIRIPQPLPILNTERPMIQQVFQNLLTNAVKFIDKPQGEILVDCVPEGDFWRFAIQDNGSGIDEKHFDKIFKIFQTLGPRSGSEGNGLGLALVKKIVESVGGRVWLRSTLGVGTIFYFTWPKTKMEGRNAA